MMNDDDPHRTGREHIPMTSPGRSGRHFFFSSRPDQTRPEQVESSLTCLWLADEEFVVAEEFVGRDFEVEWRGALADAAGDVVVGAVAGTEPAAVVAGVGDGYASEVSTDSHDDEPVFRLDAVRVGLGVPEVVHADGLGVGDFRVGAVADEDRLAAPLDGNRLADLDVRHVEFRRRQSEDVLRRRHRGDELQRADADRRRINELVRTHHQVREATGLGRIRRRLRDPILLPVRVDRPQAIHRRRRRQGTAPHQRQPGRHASRQHL
mmetsp:Transcript_29702/g.95781  ORF Transcript_29702/g.95781 Transcript_29702/m.95781 type:complete len:265 (-) Transcript_29702:52-846(-)